MATPFQARIVAPDRYLLSEDAIQVSCRTQVGEIAFLAHHIPLVGALDTCRITVKLAEGGTREFVAKGGFVEVRNNRVTLLTDTAVAVSDIDGVAARRLVEEAEARIDDGHEGASRDLAWATLLVESAAA